jgi:hypothetical protein
MTTSYSLVDVEGFHKEHWCIQIDDGPLEGYTFQYDTVKIEENQNPDDGAVLSFNTITVKEVETDLTDDEKKDILGSILVNILEEELANANRASNTEQPTT